MAFALLLWLLAAPQAESMEAFMPDNTALVVSINPRALAETPAFQSLRGRISSQWKDLEESLARLERAAPLEQIREITVIVPLDAHLRNNTRVLIRGDFDLSPLIRLARSKGLDPADVFDNGSFMLSEKKKGELALGVLPDGSVLLAEPKTLKKNLKSFHGQTRERLAPTMTSALDAADMGATMWGVASIPDNLSFLAGVSTDLPLDRFERFHFYVDVNRDFEVHLFLKVRSGLQAEVLARDLREMMGMPAKDAEKKELRKRKRLPRIVGDSTRQLLKDLSIEPGDADIEVSFTLMTDDVFRIMARASAESTNRKK